MKAKFSPSTHSFYPENMIDDDSYGSNLPKDLIDVTDEVLAMFWKTSPPEGKVLGALNNLPAWVDAPPQSKEKSVEFARRYKDGLLSEARLIIDPLQDAVDLAMATEDEKATLLEWKKYRVLIGRVDTSIAPDIIWPLTP
ncbi:tail fiber assembly protein [Yersinia enterocolitica]